MKKLISLLFILITSSSFAIQYLKEYPEYHELAEKMMELRWFRTNEGLYPFQAAFAGLIAVGNVREIRENEIDLNLKNIWCGEPTNQFVTIPIHGYPQNALSTNEQDYVFFLSENRPFDDLGLMLRNLDTNYDIFFNLNQYRNELPQIPLEFFQEYSWIPINEAYSQVIPWVSNLVDAAQIHPNRERFVEILCNSLSSTNLLVRYDSLFTANWIKYFCPTNLMKSMWLNNTNLTPHARNFIATKYRKITGESLTEKDPNHEP